MAIQNAGGDKWISAKELIAAGANLADKSLILVGGTAPANAAGAVYGVIEKDVKSGDYATVKTFPCICEVLATGAVTKGAMVEVLQGTVYANIDGTSTSTTSAGVQDVASGYPIGKALTASDAGGTVLVSFNVSQVKLV